MPRHKRFNPVVKPRLNATGKITSCFVDAGIIDGRRIRFAFAELVQSKGQDSRSARYLKDLAQKLSAFVDDFAGGCRFWLIWVASCIHSGKTVYF